MPKNTKKCIKDFIRHVEMLELEEDPDGNGFDKEYRKILDVQIQSRKDNVFTMDIGKIEVNLKKNRYKDILPYDEHRVVLSTIEGEEGSDYINASKLMGVKGTGGYIASQGPLALTVNDFWRMIWEYKVEIIFMACRIVELGKIKCKQYWNDVGKSDDFGELTVITEAEEEIASDFIQRKLRVIKGDEQRIVTHFHYSGWPDHGIPDDPAHIRDLIGIMRRARQNDEVPLLIHCSAGCGRTGAIAAIDYVWTLLEEGKFDETFNLYELICGFREQRMSIVQTPEQYALVNQVLKSLCQEWLAKMASHTYENVEPERENNYENSSAKEFIDDENVYEDSQTMSAQDLAPAPNDSQGPVVVALHRVTPAQNYQNQFLDRVPSQKAPAPPPPITAETKVTPTHSTIIQVGSPKHTTPGGTSQITHVTVQKRLSSDAIKCIEKVMVPSGASHAGKKHADNDTNSPDIRLMPAEVSKEAVNRGGSLSKPPPAIPVKPSKSNEVINKELSTIVGQYKTNVNKPNPAALPGFNIHPTVSKIPGSNLSSVDKEHLMTDHKPRIEAAKPGMDIYATVHKPSKEPVAAGNKPSNDSMLTANKPTGNNFMATANKPSNGSKVTANKPSPDLISLGLKQSTDIYTEVNNPGKYHLATAVDSHSTVSDLPQSPLANLYSKPYEYDLQHDIIPMPKKRLSSAPASPTYESVVPGVLTKPQHLSTSFAGCQVRLPRVRGPVPCPLSWRAY